jgi:hypothetical protein
MRRVLTLCSAAMFCVLLHPQTAGADIGTFIDYIFGMCGPGPVKGLGVTYEFMCFGTVPPDVDAATGRLLTPPPDRPSPASQAQPAGDAGTRFAYFPPQCSYLDQRRPLVHFTTAVSVVHTDRTPYLYDASTQTRDPDIYGIPFLAQIDGTIPGLDSEKHARLFRGVMIGAGVGAVRFSGQRFDAFWKPDLEIPRITLRPAVLFRRSLPAGYTALRGADRIQLQFITKIIGTVTAREFGGISGEKSGLYVREHVTVAVTF